MTKQITIELQEGIYKSLEYIAEATNEPIEELIVDGLYNHVIAIEDKIKEAFGRSNKA